jgi:hypothetical protein
MFSYVPAQRESNRNPLKVAGEELHATADQLAIGSEPGSNSASVMSRRRAPEIRGKWAAGHKRIRVVAGRTGTHDLLVAPQGDVRLLIALRNGFAGGRSAMFV